MRGASDARRQVQRAGARREGAAEGVRLRERSRQLAGDLGSLGIRVNCVAPGLVSPTESSRATREAVKDQLMARTPLGRIATPEDVTGPVLFLASHMSTYVTGALLPVDGGYLAA